jgi:SAM-dependent methyltransferase
MWIFEPGGSGDLRRYLRPLAGFVRSLYDPAVAPGDEVRDGVRCEGLTRLSFASASFDLVITSDIFEHVRHPARGFAELYRVLKPGGTHIFTIPVQWPMRAHTVARVDVSGADDVFLLPPVYHFSEKNLVYNDFGRDLLEPSRRARLRHDPMLFASTSATTSSQVTFCSARPYRQVIPVRPRRGAPRHRLARLLR